MHNTTCIRSAVVIFVNRAYPKKGPKLIYFQDCSQSQVRRAVKSFVGDRSMNEFDRYYQLMDTAGMFHAGKTGFVLTDDTFYSDRFKKNPIPLAGLERVERDGGVLTFIMEDGSTRRENCGEYAHYLECVFRWGILLDQYEYLKYTLKDEDAANENLQQQDLLREYTGMNCSWKEFLEIKPRVRLEKFESLKAETLKGNYDKACRLCKEFDELFADDQERYHWNQKALALWEASSIEKPDLEILCRLAALAQRLGEYVSQFYYGNLLMLHFGKEGYDRFHEGDPSHSYQLLCEAAEQSGEKAADLQKLKTRYMALALATGEWPDIASQNRKQRIYPCDAYCRSYETADTKLVKKFKELEKVPFLEETRAFYQEKAEEGNGYAMFMLSEISLDEKETLQYIKKAAEMDYPPALYEYGMRMESENPEYTDLPDREAGRMLMERAAARGWGMATLDFLGQYEEEKKDDEILLKKLTDYAGVGMDRKDYNAAVARASIALMQDDNDYVKYFESAAEMGNVEAAEYLSRAYEEVQEYGEAYKWKEVLIKNSKQLCEPIDSGVLAESIISLAIGRGVEKMEDKAFRKVIEALEYEGNEHNGDLLEYFEQYNPEIWELIVHMAQLTRDGDEKASALWTDFQAVCSGPLVEAPRTVEYYLE